MKKIIYSVFALTFILASCNNSSDVEKSHDHEAHDHGTHEHEDGEVHEDHDHAQEEFNVSDTLKK